MISYHVVILDTIELPFKLPDFGAVCIHLLTGAGPVFIKLIDDQRAVPVYHDVFNAELNGYTASSTASFIVRRIQPCKERAHAAFDFKRETNGTRERTEMLSRDIVQERAAELFTPFASFNLPGQTRPFHCKNPPP